MLEAQQLKRDWIAALRSEKYEQGFGQLRKENTFCCLGVLCDVIQSVWEDKQLWVYENGKSCYALPESILEYMNMSQDQQGMLVEMNDEKQKSFSEISEKLEAMFFGESNNEQ